MIDKLCIVTGCHPKAWFRAACHVADVRNNTARKTSNHKTPIEVREHHTPDISSPLKFQFWELVHIGKEINSFPEEGGSEGLGH